MKTRNLCVLAMLFWFGGLAVPSAANSHERVSAKIAMEIRAGEQSVWAGFRDTIRTSDRLRLYVIPKTEQYIYLVYTNFKTAQLLYQKQSAPGAVEVFPGRSNFFQTDGKSPREGFTIICSPHPLERLTRLFEKKEVSYDRWSKLVGELSKSGKIALTKKLKKPLSMAGAVRGFEKRAQTDEQLKQDLLTFSGRNLLLKRFVFDVAR